MRYCTQCGTAVGMEQAFCTRCGARLGLAAESQTSAPPPGSAPSPSPAEPDPPPPAASWLYREPGLEPPTAAWGTSVSAGTLPRTPAPSWQPSALADTECPSAGWGQPGSQADFRLPGRRRDGRVGAVIAIAAIVLVLGGGVAAGWKLLAHKTVHHTASSQASAGTIRPPSPGATAAALPGTVTVAPTASQQTSAAPVAAFLETYFHAINTRDYSSYLSLFAPELRPTLQQFQNGYGSTHDSGAVLTGVFPTAVGLAAALSFTSHQQPVDSPTGTSCTSWNITLYLKPHGGTYWIVQPPAEYHARYQAC